MSVHQLRTWGSVVLLGLILLSMGRQSHASPQPATTLLAQACAFLWQQQGEDGGWHSATHGVLKSGQALTPFVLLTLLESPQAWCPKPLEQVTRALQFLRRHINAAGVLGLADPDILEYPNYATAYALRVLTHVHAAEDAALRQTMVSYLVQQQFAAPRGIAPEHLAYGAWGFGEVQLPPGQVGHVDLSHTRRILQALRQAGHTHPATYAQAQHFLRLVQKHPTASRGQPEIGAHPIEQSPYDGGFYFSPMVLDANKAGQTTAAIRSYATATCDGILALLAAGVSPTEERVQAAQRWLQAHPTLEHPPGIPLDHPEQWHKVLFYYHLAVRTAVYHALHWPGSWPHEVASLLAARQQPDGSFVNPDGAPNKEDDPLLATALAVEALGTVVHKTQP